MDPRKRKWLIIPAILFGVFVLCVLIFFVFLNKYDRPYRFIGLTIALFVIAILCLFASLTMAIIALAKLHKKYLAFIELLVISITIVPFCMMSFGFAISFSLGYSDYQHFQKNNGTPQKYLRHGTGEVYCLYNNSHDYHDATRIYDSESKVFNLIYNAPYKKVEKIYKENYQLKYAKYGSQSYSFFKIYENGEAYIYEQGELFYSGGVQYFKYDVQIALEIIETTNQIILEKLSEL